MNSGEIDPSRTTPKMFVCVSQSAHSMSKPTHNMCEPGCRLQYVRTCVLHVNLYTVIEPAHRICEPAHVSV